MLRLFIVAHFPLHKNMQPFERDRQKLCVAQKRGELQLRCSKCWLKENCGRKSVVAKTSIFSPCSFRASERRKINILYNSAIIVKSQQWPPASESIAIYCVRKLVSCVTHLQSCAKVDIWNKKKNYVLLLRPNSRLQKSNTIATPPLNTATQLFNEPDRNGHSALWLTKKYFLV